MNGLALPGVPALPHGFLSRPRLHAVLDELAPVTVVRSLRGTGKTTAVADWVRARPGVAALWVSLSSVLADRRSISAVLVQRLAASGVQGRGEVTGADVLVELDHVLPGLLVSDRRDLVVVLDSIEYLTDPEVLRDLFSLASRHKNFHVIVCARGPHVAEALAHAVPRVCSIQTQDLQFSVEEAQALGALCRPAVDAVAAARSHREVGGWPAPLHLLLQTAARGEPVVGVAELWLRGFVIMSDRARHTVDSLLLFSLAELLDQRLVEDFAARDPSLSPFAVDLIERPGLLEQRTVAGRVVYEFPPVVVRCLRQYIGKKPEKALPFHRRLSAWYRERPGGVDAAYAFWHAVLGEDYAAAHDIWAQYSPRMTMTHPGLYARGLSRLPEEVLRRFPGMRVALAANRAAAEDSDPIGRDTTFRALAAAADRVLLTEGNDLPLPDLLSVGTGHILGLRRRGQLERASDYSDTLATRVDQLLAREDTVPASFLAWFTYQRGVTSAAVGAYTDAVHRLEEAWAHEPGHRTYVSVDAAATLAMVHAYQGDGGAAAAWLERHDRTVASEGWLDTLASAGADIARGLRALDADDMAVCESSLSRLLAVVRQHDLRAFVLHLQAQHGLRTRKPLRTLAAINRALMTMSERGNGSENDPVIRRAQADLLIAGNRAHLVRELVEASHQPLLLVPFARFLCLTGREQRALSVIGKAETESLSARDQLELLLVEISTTCRIGERQRAAELLTMAHELARTLGVAQPLTALPASDRATLGVQVDAPAIYPDRLDLIELTRRERDLLDALVVSNNRKEVADRLFVSMNTIKTQLAGLYRKLGATTQSEAIEIARVKGLLARQTAPVAEAE